MMQRNPAPDKKMHLQTKKASNTDAKSKCSQAAHAEMHLQTKKASNEDAKSKCNQATHAATAFRCNKRLDFFGKGFLKFLWKAEWALWSSIHF